ncbi:hypothetical protein Klosneuvirus_5_91 [Klosneuvirus KNV1]|uniref:Uncharacterized protein n=1 Tax=Klosneuvirus KNV1 TaxID=1977640 RepID=A0A1V0SL80_9VIRU|nr:hypothetical protein Klosneuvirus_5_91 [Klosneuvirus KNV1]
MSLLNLFWHLNVTDNTKTIMVLGIIVLIIVMCYFSGKKKSNKKIKKKHLNNLDDTYINYLTKLKPSMCEKRYMQCKESNVLNGSDDFCVPCLNDGKSPNFFYDPEKKEWIKSG